MFAAIPSKPSHQVILFDADSVYDNDDNVFRSLGFT